MYIDAEYRKRFARKSALTVSAKIFATVKSVRLNQTLTTAYAYPKSAMRQGSDMGKQTRYSKIILGRTAQNIPKICRLSTKAKRVWISIQKRSCFAKIIPKPLYLNRRCQNAKLRRIFPRRFTAFFPFG